MSHTCDAVVVACEDFRLHQRKDGRNYMVDFLRKRGLDCDNVIRAGAAQAIVRPGSQDYLQSVKDCLDVSVFLHKAEVVMLMNHDDCGAYSHEFPSFSFDELREKAIADLYEAKEVVQGWYPQAEVELYFGYLLEGSKDVFEILELE